jgi:hypothetical protein
MAVKMVTFPGQQEIIAYFNIHPGHNMVLQSENITKNFPGATDKIAAFFANKIMKQSEILDSVSAVLLGPKEWEAEKNAMEALNEIVSRLEKKSDADSTTEIEKWKTTRSEVQQANSLVTVTAKFYSAVLNDLLDKATFTPPSPAEKRWKKHIPVVILTKHQ